MEIVLREIYVGSCSKVALLEIEGDTAANDFLDLLITSNPHAANSLKTSMATITAVDNYHNDRKFKRVAPGVYEIKVPGVRFYCFKEQLEEGKPPLKLIVATNGGGKNTKKEQGADIKKACRIRDQYLTLKGQEGITFRYIEL